MLDNHRVRSLDSAGATDPVRGDRREDVMVDVLVMPRMTVLHIEVARSL